ncbi:hypothetical protein SAMN05518801_105243 [Novosphingobium sp. CF614]|uniref:hypothetical protein n=1 Tax=Novosphingobium sp. CF614 TaxID=1884364 RepID=UPI0008DF90C6|nr:hypothetical protein [Novosphingobium sp. CF614]SFG02166.1 hypothetical protein SAMN05518801_105243 [Novosphingobium sp. CF614]
MLYSAVSICEPKPFTALFTFDDDGELIDFERLSATNYARRVGGMRAMGRINQAGRYHGVHHLRYDPSRPGFGHDEIGRPILRVDPVMTLTLAGGRAGRRAIERMFLSRAMMPKRHGPT